MWMAEKYVIRKSVQIKTVYSNNMGVVLCRIRMLQDAHKAISAPSIPKQTELAPCKEIMSQPRQKTN